MRPGTRLRLLGLASFLSGAAAVGYEVVWIRRLGELFGHAVLSIQVVLAIFFLGLGVGAWLGGRAADRLRGSIALYAALEAVIALAGFAFLPGCELVERLYLGAQPAEWPPVQALAVKGIASAALLAVPTLAMGATLPALTRHVVHRSGQLAPRLSWLYGANTIGAAAAALGTVAWLLPSLGVWGSLGALAAANAAALSLALVARSPVGGEPSPVAPEEPRAAPEGAPATAPAPRDRLVLLGAAAVSGFVAVGLEVGWTRALASRFSSTVYSFAVLLCAFLLALGVGALVVAGLDRLRWTGRRSLVVAVCGSGIAAVLSVGFLDRVPILSIDSSAGAAGLLDWRALERRELFHALSVMAPALLLLGVNLPLIAHLSHRQVRRVGRELGGVWLANTIGSVAAPLVVGFLVLPSLGIAWTIAALGWGAIAFGAFVLLPWSRARGPAGAWVALALGAAATWGLPADVRLWRESDRDQLVAYREGLMASVAVVDTPDGDRILKVNHGYELGSRRTRFAQARQGWIPLLLHPDPESVLMIGMGTGSSAGAVLRHGGVDLDIVEIVPELRELLPLFADVNEDLASRARRDPAVRIFSTDARQFVRATDRRYDVVIGDLFVPWRAGEGAMYTREHFAAVRAALAGDGLFCQWLPLYQLRGEELRTIVATFLDVFPTASLWWLYFNVEQPVVGLVGTADDRGIDLVRLGSRVEDPRRLDARMRDGLDRAGPLLGSWITDHHGLRDWAGNTPVETTARPRIEFLAPRHHLARARSAPDENVPLVLGFAAPRHGATASDAEEPGEIALARAYHRTLARLFHALHLRRWRGDLGGALEILVLAAEGAPEWSFLWWNLEVLAAEAIRSGEHELVARCAEQLSSTPALTFLVRHLEALEALRTGDRPRARQLLEQALEANPRDESSRRLLKSLSAS